ncbi:MAG TPA: translation elongation factor Ts [Stellaceae bacterium]|jgi:elongation factor Ts|nr:translation elongation factor Ts [Stellaceae bacterium]
MPEVTAALVKELREKTGAGMMDCKRALGDSNGDIEAAVDWLRKKGLSAAAKKAGRVAAEGLVGVATRGTAGALVEVNSETDFVARNEAFQAFVRSVAELAVIGEGELETLTRTPYPGTGRTVEEELTHLIATIGENLVLRRASRLAVAQGGVSSYMHNALGPGLGKIGVIVALESTAPAAALSDLGRQLAMHVAAASPLYLDIASVPQAALERERGVLREQARSSGKSEGIVERMVEGRLRKFYEEVVLLEQIFVVDQETRIAKVVENAAKAAGGPIAVTGFARYALGEGVERNRTDFAAEVAAATRVEH